MLSYAWTPFTMLLNAAVIKTIKDSGKGILEITKEQKMQFAGNMLLSERGDGPIIFGDERWLPCTYPQQVARIDWIIKSFIDLPSEIWAVEMRCMLAKFTYPKNLNHVRDSDSGHVQKLYQVTTP